jgi:hypothetical protein
LFCYSQNYYSAESLVSEIGPADPDLKDGACAADRVKLRQQKVGVDDIYAALLSTAPTYSDDDTNVPV